MKRRYIYILILTMVVCLNACGKPEKAADTSSDNKKETVSQTATLGETEVPGVTKNPVTEDDTENDLPMIEFEKPAEKPEEGTAAPNWSQDVTAKPIELTKKATEPTEKPAEPSKNSTEPTKKPTQPSKKATEPTENSTENPAETSTIQPVEAPTQQPAQNPTEPTPEPAEKPIELPFAPIN